MSEHPPLGIGAALRIYVSKVFAPVRTGILTGASLLHQKVKNKGNHDASHDLRGDGCEKQHVVSEDLKGDVSNG